MPKPSQPPAQAGTFAALIAALMAVNAPAPNPDRQRETVQAGMPASASS